MNATVVGAGLAGVEAAWALAERGHGVELVEMRPATSTPAHQTAFFAELVCSNSLKSARPETPAGVLKAEMSAMGSLVLEVAEQHRVPGGEALAVDREAFSKAITERIAAHPNVVVRQAEFGGADVLPSLQQGPLILATGPLTSPDLSTWLAQAAGRTHLHFYDAVSPTVDAASIDASVAFAQSRYDKGGDDYLNCPFDKDQYLAFVEALVAAERVPVHAFEAGGVREGDAAADEAFLQKVKYFAGCMPIEEIARGGPMSLAFGNFKPVGLTDPRTGRRPFAALQLRPENRERTLYSLVACQNRLRWGEQKRVFRMVPGLESAEFIRYGVIHRNTYIDAPRLLDSSLQLFGHEGLFVTGQLTGVEGYVESAAMGIYAGLAAGAKLEGRTISPPPRASALGSLLSHLADQTPREFAPMNINWGLFPEPEPPAKHKHDRRAAKLELARTHFEDWILSIGELAPNHPRRA